MNHIILTLSVRTRRTFDDLGARIAHAWHERADERGMDEAVTKMIWLAVGITVAIAAGAFFTDVFESARDNVPDPVTP